MKHGLKKIVLFIITISCITLAAGCSFIDKNDENNESGFNVYYINPEETDIVAIPYNPIARDIGELTSELVEALTRSPESESIVAPLSGGFSLLSVRNENGQIVLDVDSAFKQMSPVREVLTRAAIVRTLCQIPEITYVTITVNGEPLTDVNGIPVGAMSEEMFIYNAGQELHTYEKVNLKLYFADKNGEYLKALNREVVYNSNVSMERLIVEQLISGTELGDYYPTINPAVRIVSVRLQDRVCYVTFDATFIQLEANLKPQIVIYSIVNSLTEMANVSRVQISIDGNTDLIFNGDTDLNTQFERNMELVK